MNERYPWLWDVELDNETFEGILRGDHSPPPYDANWALVRLIEYAPYEQIRRLLPREAFLDRRPKLAQRVRSRSRREGMDYFYQHLREKTPCHA